MTEKSLKPETILNWEPYFGNNQESDCVTIKAPQEDLYRLFLFCEERMADNLRMGTRMPPIELHKLMCAMYALRDATMQLQAGEQVEPTTSGSGHAR